MTGGAFVLGVAFGAAGAVACLAAELLADVQPAPAARARATVAAAVRTARGRTVAGVITAHDVTLV
jgi:hypothetical protein